MAEKIIRQIIMNNAQFEYALIQRGALDKYKSNPQNWLMQYHDSLESEYRLIEPYLPAMIAPQIMDLGSGIGGLNILLNAHYQSRASFALVDGVDDPPLVSLHRKTFNSMKVAQEFLRLNGIPKFLTIDAASPASIPSRFNLVISLQAWCFHFEPAQYLEFAFQSMAPGAVLIVDVRKEKTKWLDELKQCLIWVDCIHRSFKFDTHVFAKYESTAAA